MKNRWIKNRRLCTIASNFEIRGKDRILTSFSVLVKQSRATVSNPPWYESPCKERGACHHVGVRLPRNLSHLSVSYQRTFPPFHLLLDSYNPIDVALHERDASTRISPIVCVYLLACVVGGTNVTTRYDRIILRTFLCPPLSRLILHPVSLPLSFSLPSFFFFFRWFL